MTDLPYQNLLFDKLEIIEEQYRRLIFVDLKEIFQNSSIPTDAEEFWMGMKAKEDFTDLAQYALDCLTTPISNATVERVFSLVTSVKTKVRNRMGLQLLDAILRIKTELYGANKCCKDFSPTEAMLSKFNTKNLYENKDVGDKETFESILNSM